MSNVTLNRHGIDHVAFTLTTTGSNVASATLDKLLLDPTKQYVLRINELNAPTNGIPLFGFDAEGGALATDLFQIRRRVVGTNRNNFNTSPQFGADFPTIFGTFDPITEQDFFTVASFLTSLAKHGNNFTQQQDGIGVPGVPANSQHEYLRIRLNADGCVEWIGSSTFWENFAIKFTHYGEVLFGVSALVDGDRIMSVTTLADHSITHDMFDQTGVIADTTNDPAYLITQETVRLTSGTSIFTHLDHRYFVSVETDLMVQNQVKVVDGRETIDRTIAKKYFSMPTKVLLQSSDGLLSSDIDFELETPLGQYSFIKKTEPSRHWVSLTTSYELRYFVFRLYITYRRFEDGKFLMRRVKYPVSLNDNYTIGVEFVSKV